MRGGGFSSVIGTLAASGRQVGIPGNEFNFVGFRVASIIPEPGTGLLTTFGLLGFAGWRLSRLALASAAANCGRTPGAQPSPSAASSSDSQSRSRIGSSGWILGESEK